MERIIEIRLTKFEVTIIEDIIKRHLDYDLKNLSSGTSFIQDTAVEILLKLSNLLDEYRDDGNV